MVSSFGQICNIATYQISNGIRALDPTSSLCLWSIMNDARANNARLYARRVNYVIKSLRQICILPLVCLKLYRIFKDFCPHFVFQKCSKVPDSSTRRIYVNRIHVLENLETTFKHSFSFTCYIYPLSEVDLTCDSDGEQLRWSFKCGTGMFQNCC